MAACPAKGCPGDIANCPHPHVLCVNCNDWFSDKADVVDGDSPWKLHKVSNCVHRLDLLREVESGTMPECERAKWEQARERLRRPDTESISRITESLQGDVSGKLFRSHIGKSCGTRTNPFVPGIVAVVMRSPQESNFPLNRHGYQIPCYRNIRALHSRLHPSHRELVDRALLDAEDYIQRHQPPVTRPAYPVRVDASWSPNQRELLYDIMVSFFMTWVRSYDVATSSYVAVDPEHEIQRLSVEVGEGFADLCALAARYDRGTGVKQHRSEGKSATGGLVPFVAGCIDCGKVHSAACRLKIQGKSPPNDLHAQMKETNANMGRQGKLVIWGEVQA
jgi:hypothetical protein